MIRTNWIALYAHGNNNVTYFDSFGVEYIPKETKSYWYQSNKSIKTNTYRIQVCN